MLFTKRRPEKTQIVEPPKPVVLIYTDYSLKQLKNLDQTRRLISTIGIIRGVTGSGIDPDKDFYYTYGYLQDENTFVEFRIITNYNTRHRELSAIRTASESGLPIKVEGEFPNPYHEAIRARNREIYIHTLQLGDNKIYFNNLAAK